MSNRQERKLLKRGKGERERVTHRISNTERDGYGAVREIIRRTVIVRGRVTLKTTAISTGIAWRSALVLKHSIGILINPVSGVVVATARELCERKREREKVSECRYRLHHEVVDKTHSILDEVNKLCSILLFRSSTVLVDTV